MVGRRKRALQAKGLVHRNAQKEAREAKKSQKIRSARAGKEDRRAAKLERRKKEKKSYTAQDWAEPAPDHLIAKLDLPKHSSKYQSYFEFAENKEKKKKLEFQVTNDPNPPPGFTYVPIGDPTLTNACKELSREQNAMIFIVSRSKEDNSKISEHVFRTGYHFREVIVDEARKIVGDTVVSNTAHGLIEPIPESQEEINKQADGAIRDLFPRIPNTDRQRIIEHAFQKGVKFHGEPTVGLQADLPLARRVQLAVLAHIRHTHTRYDKLLRETSWINARKVVEPVCLDVLVKWRGDEETGRDQMDEILREVVIITDSDEEDDDDDDEDDDDDDDSDEDEDSEEDEEEDNISAESTTMTLQAGPQSRQPLGFEHNSYATGAGHSGFISSHSRSRVRPNEGPRKLQPRFKRYQAAWDEALNRRQNADELNGASKQGYEASIRPAQSNNSQHYQEMLRQQAPTTVTRPNRGTEYLYHGAEPRHSIPPEHQIRHHYPQERPPSRTLIRRDEVTVRPLHDRPAFHPPNLNSAPQVSREPRSQVAIRASPTRSGFQDMLALSIEEQNDNMNMSPRLDRDAVSDPGRHQASFPRRVVERSRMYPGLREVIVIDDDDDDDDSPYPKRRRVIEDDYGRFRPYPSREQDGHTTPNFPTKDANRRPIALPRHTEGLSTNLPTASSRPVLSERVPIYEMSDFRPHEMHSDSSRRDDERITYRQHVPISRRKMAMPRPYLMYSDETCDPQRVASDNVRVAERDQFVRPEQVEPGQRYYLQRPASPDQPVSRKISRSQNMDGPADQAFIQRFSQSEHEPSFSRPQDGPVSYQRFIPNVHRQADEPDQLARPFTVIRPVQARPPARYLDMPEIPGERSDLPIYYERHDPHITERHMSNHTMRVSVPPDGNGPAYTRIMQPSRQFITLG